jgi:predicted DNA-binding transcriptional regulator YafY
MAKHYFNRLEYLDYLIRLKATGAPDSLAKKLSISVRTAFGYIDILKSLGAPIAYNKEKETYYYTESGSFHFKFQKDKFISDH